MMKRLIAVAVAIAAVFILTETNTNAQGFLGGYQFSAGLQSNCNQGMYRFQREQPPYFAKFPPVYYSHVVKRPYGISPYAAPAGIAPVEMSVPTMSIIKPITKINPYYQPEIEPVADTSEAPADSATSENKVTWKTNPFFRQSTVMGIVQN